MTALFEKDATKEVIGDKRVRYLTHSENLMVVVIDFDDGPSEQPDEPHSHPHEQITYVVAGEVLYIIDGEESHLRPGDMIVTPPDKPHGIKLLTKHVRLVDCFSPIREDFLSK